MPISWKGYVAAVRGAPASSPRQQKRSPRLRLCGCDGAYAGSHVQEEACRVRCARLYGCRGRAELMLFSEDQFWCRVIPIRTSEKEDDRDGGLALRKNSVRFPSDRDAALCTPRTSMSGVHPFHPRRSNVFGERREAVPHCSASRPRFCDSTRDISVQGCQPECRSRVLRHSPRWQSVASWDAPGSICFC